MSFAESWIVTLLGTGVVFTGLVLTYLTIVLIIKLPLLAAKWKKPPVPAVTPQIPVPAGPNPVQISNEKMAVIAAVLEVELRLRKNVANTRFTFRK